VLKTALDGYSLRVLSFTGEEAVSRLFHFRVRVNAHPRLTTPQLLGQNVDLVLASGPLNQRRFLAKINSVEELGTDEHSGWVYNLDLVPRFWALTQTVRARIFENDTALNIIDKVMAQSGVRVLAPSRADTQKRPYCVQYFETDFDFVARLLEEEGYIYTCGDQQGQPTLAIESFPSSFPKTGAIPFHEMTGGPEHRIGHWQTTRILTATSMSGRDHFFEAASPVMEGATHVAAPNAAIPGWEALNASWAASIDHYPAGWAHLFEEVAQDGVVKPPTGYTDFGSRQIVYALQQAVGSTSASEGASNCLELVPASVFELHGHATCSGEHFVVSVRHTGSQALDHSTSHVREFTYENQFTSVPYSGTMMYLPPRITHKRLIYGCQTAKVVGGTDGSEIWTDKYGRVQVQFWWDRDNKASSWIRVATPWAGSGWGMQHIPRVGQEVVVTFLDGDPDRPLIVGSVYNPSQMPPFGLPDNRTQSGIRTHSTPGGASGESNEIRFEDSKGKEELYTHAQKDQTGIVENDSSEWVKNDSYDVVNGNVHSTTYGKKYEAVADTSDLMVFENSMNAFKKNLGIGAAEIHLKAGKIVIEADAISIRTSDKGKEFIYLGKGEGITIDSKGEKVWVNCGGTGSPDDGCFTTPTAPTDPFNPPDPAEKK
jgi:type VI secretion system secreted protein VgrG